MSVRAGTVLDARYRLAERIAVGGMGEVWRGTDELLGRPVAVKVLRAELAEDLAFRKRFRAEARTAGSLSHSGIAAVFDYRETSVGPDGVSPSREPVQGDGIAYLVMELVPGEALSTILAREGALTTDRTLSAVAQAARALHAAHLKGVVHRDVKPANLMVTPDGRVKVTDFGIARPLDHEPLTMTGQVMGTAHYLAPELARGYDASPLSDVYALGVVAYECLAGHRPFDGDNQVLVATAHLSQQPPPLPGTIAPDVIAAVGAAMEKDPQERVRSAEAFAVVLEKLLKRDPTALNGIGGAGRGGLSAARAPLPARSPGRPGGAVTPSEGAGAAGAAARTGEPPSRRSLRNTPATAPQGVPQTDPGLWGPDSGNWSRARDGADGRGGAGRSARAVQGYDDDAYGVDYGSGYGEYDGSGSGYESRRTALRGSYDPGEERPRDWRTLIPTPLAALLGLVALVVLGTVVVKFFTSGGPQAITPTPSRGVYSNAPTDILTPPGYTTLVTPTPGGPTRSSGRPSRTAGTPTATGTTPVRTPSTAPTTSPSVPRTSPSPPPASSPVPSPTVTSATPTPGVAGDAGVVPPPPPVAAVLRLAAGGLR